MDDVKILSYYQLEENYFLYILPTKNKKIVKYFHLVSIAGIFVSLTS